MLSHHAASVLLPAGPSKPRMQLDASLVCQCGGMAPAHSRPTGPPALQQPSACRPCWDKDDSFRWQGGMSRRRSGGRVVLHAAQSGKMDPEAVRASVNRAAGVLEEVLNDILQELLVDQAASYLTEESPELNEMEAVRNAVIQRIELLDANFLAALNGYIQVASLRPNDGMLSLLLALRDEVLRQVSMRLPPTARVMDAALQLMYKDNRVHLLKTAIDWQRTSSTGMEQVEPTASASAAEVAGSSGPADQASTATIDVQAGDDSDQEAAHMKELLAELPAGVDADSMVATSRLLARMCLVREEVRWLDQEQNFTSSSSSSTEDEDSKKRRVSSAYFARSNVPQRCIAYLKGLLVLNDPAQRVALLSRAFVEDWDGTTAPSGNKGQEQLDTSQPSFWKRRRKVPGLLPAKTLRSVLKSCNGCRTSTLRLWLCLIRCKEGSSKRLLQAGPRCLLHRETEKRERLALSTLLCTS
ncbi:hypothetical protein DUNSADRAFT_3339 [Dunaliella salina]|uniref:CTLH domain-containing protein n=1 Tax=Dunaliella salina TaxID=3046 RepID=A0ABQ7GU84_DUNSA|nr:hypothetical protein DUNSADRAFT_3339 [Dunaliella salina]|eukprot:KAF5838144.1 hypothetical protein DUNSADRAFT_3339 [Dunaliella salina]